MCLCAKPVRELSFTRLMLFLSIPMGLAVAALFAAKCSSSHTYYNWKPLMGYFALPLTPKCNISPKNFYASAPSWDPWEFPHCAVISIKWIHSPIIVSTMAHFLWCRHAREFGCANICLELYLSSRILRVPERNENFYLS